MNKIVYKELIAFHPGYYVKDLIDAQGMNQEELAKRLQTSGKYVSDLINGRVNLTEEMVLRLSIVFGTSTAMWLNLNKTFIEKKLEIESKIREGEECSLVKQIDYKFWVELNLVKPATKAIDKVRELQKYFKVSSLSVLQQRDFLVQYRTTVSEIKDINVINANAWVQTALNLGAQTCVQPFDKKTLMSQLGKIREMTIQEPEIFYPKMKKILADCGVALVVLPNLKNCGVNGAVKWMSKDKVVLAINDRRKYADSFWFSLFHELGHVMQQRIKVLLISEKQDCLETNELLQKLETEADNFAQNILIPQKEYQQFVEQTSYFDKNNITEFAEKLKIHPGIVVGRLQQDQRLRYDTTLNSLKVKYYVA